jgi:hypothetical protein
MIRRILFTAALALVSAMAMSQTYPFTGPTRTFSPWTASNPQSWTFAPAYPAAASGTSNVFTTTTYINVDPYVFVGGLWDDTVTVQGMGSGTSAPGANQIQILTNMDINFQFLNFGAVTAGPGTGTAVPGPNSITVNYNFVLFGDWTTGTTIDNTGAVQGPPVGAPATLSVTNSTATPQSAGPLVLPLASTNNGVGGLIVGRNVAVTGQLPGDRQYVSTGNVVVTIN